MPRPVAPAQGADRGSCLAGGPGPAVPALIDAARERLGLFGDGLSQCLLWRPAHPWLLPKGAAPKPLQLRYALASVIQGPPRAPSETAAALIAVCCDPGLAAAGAAQKTLKRFAEEALARGVALGAPPAGPWTSTSPSSGLVCGSSAGCARGARAS
ncbi:MAG: hypothetical protein HUK26_07985 [Duodenibacillus sp.]|nr:hypothetical protein [Duodenibacillus sp.]